MEINFNAKKARELTKTVKETNKILKNVCEQNFMWDPIIRSIRNGRNIVVINTSCKKQLNFVNELKELGYKVTIDEKMFHTEVIIKW